MIKRYTAASGTANANDPGVSRPISINRRSICLAEDVSALEKKVYDLGTENADLSRSYGLVCAENADLRERVGVLEAIIVKIRDIAESVPELDDTYSECDAEMLDSGMNDIYELVRSSPVDVEKGEEG